MPRIGLVCEGATDRAAIEYYVRESLSSRGYANVVFLEIPAHRNKTAAIHGWSMVLAWLSKSPQDRNRYLTSPFAGNLHTQTCDAIVVHLDADNLSDAEFRRHVAKWYNTTVKDPNGAQHRGNEIERIVRQVAKLSSQKRGDFSSLYIIASAVEATETWCLSASRFLNGNPEKLSGLALCQEFMTALHASEGRPIGGRVFSNISKDVKRRKRFCRRTSCDVRLIESQCYHYKKLIVDLCKVI